MVQGKEIPHHFLESEYIVLNNHLNDFTTANAIVEATNNQFGEQTARALDGTSSLFLLHRIRPRESVYFND